MTDYFAGFIVFLLVLVIWEKAFLEFRWREWTSERKDYLERLERRYDEFVSYVNKSHFGMVPNVIDNSTPPDNPETQKEQTMRDEVEKISQQDTISDSDIQKIKTYEELYGEKK